MLPEGNEMMSSTYEAKKTMKAMGSGYTKCMHISMTAFFIGTSTRMQKCVLLVGNQDGKLTTRRENVREYFGKSVVVLPPSSQE